MAPLRILIVDDSHAYRGLLRELIDAETDMEVVGSVPDGKLALGFLSRHPTDIVILDIEMPVMDGLTALPEIVRLYPQVKVVVVSTLTTSAAAATLDALAKGAVDCIPKPSATRMSITVEKVSDMLIRKIRGLGRKLRAPVQSRTTLPVTTPTSQPTGKREKARILVIGASTGGPNAIETMLRGLGPAFEIPILIVQHMPAVFTRVLAGRLQQSCRRPCHEAQDGEPILPGHAYVAPGEFHMVVAIKNDRPILKLNQEPPEQYCRPALDPLLRSLVDTYGGATLVTMLTGMGADGRRGCEALHAVGARIYAQDEETSVVWGMPGAVVQAGLATAVVPLGELAMRLRGAAAR